MDSRFASVPLPKTTHPSADSPEKKECFQGVSLEDALTLSGFGRFQRWITLVGGLCWMACGFQNSLNAYILPSVRCDMSVSSSMMGLFNAVFLAGGLSSSFLWGALVESLGRWPVLLFGMSADAILAFLSSSSQNFHLLLVFRFLNGFVVGGPAAIAPAYVGEFQPVAHRRAVLCYLGFFWTMSWVILPGVAWVVIPQEWTVSWAGWRFNSWRLLVFLVGLPSLASALLVYRFPESPKFLLAQGREAQALGVLAHIYAANTGHPPSDYPVKSLEVVGGSKSAGGKTRPKSILTPLANMLRQCRTLLARPVLPVTLLGMYLFFANMFGYYGLGLWLPELVHRFEEHYAASNETLSVCELRPAAPVADDACTVPSTVFTHSLVIGSMGLLGNVLSGLLSTRLSRPVMPVALMTGAGLSVFALYFVTNSFQNMVVSSVFQLCVGTANMVYNSIIVDMFPPEICGLAVCVLVMMGRLGAVVSNLVLGHLLDHSCTVPILLCAAVILFGGVLSSFIPKNPWGQNGEFEEDQNRKTAIKA